MTAPTTEHVIVWRRERGALKRIGDVIFANYSWPSLPFLQEAVGPDSHKMEVAHPGETCWACVSTHPLLRLQGRGN